MLSKIAMNCCSIITYATSTCKVTKNISYLQEILNFCAIYGGDLSYLGDMPPFSDKKYEELSGQKGFAVSGDSITKSI